MMKVVEKWLNWKEVSEGRSVQTSVKYRNYLLRLSVFLKTNNVDFLQADKDVLESWTGMQLFNDGLSARSRRAAIASVKGFFGWLRKQGLRTDDPAGGLVYPKAGRRLPRPMLLKQAELLLKQPNLDTFIGIRDTAILFVLMGCGLRVSEVCRLDVSSLMFHLDDDECERLVIRVLGKGGKERLVPAPDEARLMLRAYMNHPDLLMVDRLLDDGAQVLFVSVRNRLVAECDYIGEHRRLSARSINSMIERYGVAAGIDRSVLHPHALRHLYGAEMFENDVNILIAQSLLGHANPATTEIYSHIAVRRLQREADRANPLGRINSPATEMMRIIKASR